MDSTHWPQVLVKNMEEASVERKLAKPGKDEILKCPRCNSTNTKFCYYNNYSLSQPRYFCKSCRRYWTAGGSLRNIPVGGASRKNKKPSSISTSIKNQNPTCSSNSLSDMISSKELIPFMPMPAASANSSDHHYNPLIINEFKPSFNLSNDIDHGFESVINEEPNARNDLFSVEDHFKQVPTINSESDHQNGGKLGDLTGFWNGIFGGGSW